ncbi:hypothetical protein ACFL96_14135 [Thermoproteota archaeon]
MSRWTSQKRGERRLLLIIRDKNKCNFCNKNGLEYPYLKSDGRYDLGLINAVCERDDKDNLLKGEIMDIHHLDGNPRNNESKNNVLACHSCNCKQINLGLKQSGFSSMCADTSSASSHTYNENIGKFERPPTTKPIARNEVLKRAWKPYLISMIEDGQNKIDDICNGFAPYVYRVYEKHYGSAETAKRYLSEDTSFYGDFKIEWVNGEEYVVYKNEEIRKNMRNTYSLRAVLDKKS